MPHNEYTLREKFEVIGGCPRVILYQSILKTEAGLHKDFDALTSVEDLVEALHPLVGKAELRKKHLVVPASKQPSGFHQTFYILAIRRAAVFTQATLRTMLCFKVCREAVPSEARRQIIGEAVVYD